ncbi:hypothetical protein [Streptomyces sp. NPDC007369]|uniref:hypothetical protein n=1 Tax=Streptomyces sp. NPDC007369 TaxID=3154589 RepID=UPI0033D77895
MSERTRAGSAYILEKAYRAQAEYSVLFVYSRRDHVRALLQDMLVDNDPEETGLHFDGESADLWLVEHGHRVGHIDLHPLIRRTDDREVVIDWAGFEAAVPAALSGPVLRRGEELALHDPAAEFPSDASDLPCIYPDQAVRYGMQVWVDGELSDQPYEVYRDPDPAPPAG